MAKAFVIHADQVKPFVLDESYASKMLLDDEVAGTPTININQGTLRGGGKTAGGVHTENEIYYVVQGEARLHLGDDSYHLRPGSLVFIPTGTFHALENLSPSEDFVLLTFWENAEDNEVWHLRRQAWGKTFKTIDEN